MSSGGTHRISCSSFAGDDLHNHPLLEREYELMGTSQLSLVHPQKYLYSIEWGLDLQQRLEG